MRKFIANRLSIGNTLFPTEITIDTHGINVKRPGLFSMVEKSLTYDKISSVKYHSPTIGFSKIVFNTIGLDSLTAHGFDEADAEEIKSLVQEKMNSPVYNEIDKSDYQDILMKKLEFEKLQFIDAKEWRAEVRRKVKADELRTRGKYTLAFFVEMNPIYLVGLIYLSVIILGILIYII